MYTEELIINRLYRNYDEKAMAKEMYVEAMEEWLRGKFPAADQPTDLRAYLSERLTFIKELKFNKTEHTTFEGYPDFFLSGNGLYSVLLNRLVCDTQHTDCEAAYETILATHKHMLQKKKEINKLIADCKKKMCTPEQKGKLDNVSIKIFEALAEKELNITSEHHWVHKSEQSVLYFMQMNHAKGQEEEVSIVISHDPYLKKMRLG